MLIKNIVLIGFMGSGKSMVSNRLADLLKKEVISSDGLVEQREGRSIIDIFQSQGEDYFRAVESQIIHEISQKTGVIIDSGGGVILNAENFTALKKNGIIFYLSASPEFLLKQIQLNQDRPLMQVDDPLSKIKEMLVQRKSLYEQADFTVISEGHSVQEIAEEIITIYKRTQ